MKPVITCQKYRFFSKSIISPYNGMTPSLEKLSTEGGD
jgi:hypothetical protein